MAAMYCAMRGEETAGKDESPGRETRGQIRFEALVAAGGTNHRHGAYESPPAAGGYAARRTISHSLPRPLFRNRSLARASLSHSYAS